MVISKLDLNLKKIWKSQFLMHLEQQELLSQIKERKLNYKILSKGNIMKARGILPMEKKEHKKKLEATYLDIAIPSNVENLQLPDPTLLQFYKNYDDRIIWIDDEITTMTLEYAKMIMQWNSEDKKNNIPV